MGLHFYRINCNASLWLASTCLTSSLATKLFYLRTYMCRKEETTSFLDLVAEIGPKLLMETALRRYSVLSVNSTIVIELHDSSEI
ncbi:Ubiquitin fusion degradation protein [Phytophthora cinnamomi]|uniref:Ubiquitin fusion degradation protein n=1 Tax=Phytophthora cinnamomi TaxID=4785 RepID=UPI00355A2FE6|nr:Ubiquitin fusion degradation protein [Phytophthora cinnamomi]